MEPRRIAKAKNDMENRRQGFTDNSGASETATLTNAQGLCLFVRLWRPEAGCPVRGLVVVHHGMTVHSGPFGPLAQRLAAQGLAVVAFDMQGHGLSDSFEGIRGYARRFSDLVDDSAQVLAWAQERFPGAPTFLVGESMGGTVTLEALRRQDVRDRVRGAVLLAPAIRVSPEVLPPKPVLAVLRGIAALFPRTPVPDDNITNPAKWTGAFGDQAFAEAAVKNPLFTLSPPRLRMLGMMPAFEDLYGHLEQITTPFLVCHAPDDSRCAFANSRALVERAASGDKELLVVPGGRHMLLQDQPDITAAVTERITQWLSGRC